MPGWRMKGQYLKNCSCVPGCPCDTHGYPGPNEFCEAIVGMNVVEGNFEQTDLSGLRWVATLHWPKALHDGNGTAEFFIDERADDAQRGALGKILGGEAGGPLFEIFASIVTTSTDRTTSRSSGSSTSTPGVLGSPSAEALRPPASRCRFQRRTTSSA